MRILKKIFLFILLFSIQYSIIISQTYGEKYQIPENQLKSMTTEELIESYLESRLAFLIFAYDDLQDGFKRVYNDFNGLRELMTRNDVGVKLLNYYKNLKVNECDLNWDLITKARYTFKFIYAEILLSQPEIINQFSKDDVNMLLDELRKKYENKLKHSDTYSLVHQTASLYTAMVISIYSKKNSIDKNLFRDLLNQSLSKKGNYKSALQKTESTSSFATFYTPEGMPVNYIYQPGDHFDDTDRELLRIELQNIINAEGLNAEIIAPANFSYNCYGYAWTKSENRGTYWIDQIGSEFFLDHAYSNDGEPSYIPSSESEATHVADSYYGHAARKIQNSYPRTSSEGRDYVSKMSYLGLVQHEKYHDIYRLKRTNNPPDYYKLKTSHSGTLSNYPKTWVGAGGITHTCSNDVTVNNSLTILADTEVEFTSGAKLTINGTLTADGGSSSTPITFDFGSPNSTTENGIVLTSSSSGTINYCQVRNAYRGIYENSVSINITNSAISGCTDGVYLYSSSPTIQECNIYDNSYSGIYLVSSSPYLYNNYMQDNSYGVYCTTSSNPKFGNGSTQGKNNITGNTYGVFCWNNSLPMLGRSSPLDGGYNNLVNTTWNVYILSSGSIYANHNWWGTTIPANFKIAGTGGVATGDYLSSAVSIPTPPLSKSGNLTTDSDSGIPLLSKLNKAYQLIASDNLEEAREICLTLVNNYPGYSVSYNALNLLKETYTEKELTAKKDMYKALFNQKSKKDLYAMAGLILSDIDEDNRVKYIDKVIEKYEGESVVKLAMFDKFVYYYFEEEDKEKARAISEELDSQFELTRGAVDAHKILGDEKYYEIEVAEKQAQKDTVNQSSEEYEYSLLENYPNPFNPTTKIKFSISEASNVTLKVYNTLGEEVKVLVNEMLQPGKYERIFDAGNLASGVYIYKLTAGKYREVKKMLLLR
ncbi:MAG: T9SS type A sorting domain-containing protein [Ignavibacteria bacterium]|jgi:parallel beta-helix repeat protein